MFVCAENGSQFFRNCLKLKSLFIDSQLFACTIFLFKLTCCRCCCLYDCNSLLSPQFLLFTRGDFTLISKLLEKSLNICFLLISVGLWSAVESFFNSSKPFMECKYFYELKYNNCNLNISRFTIYSEVLSLSEFRLTSKYTMGFSVDNLLLRSVSFNTTQKEIWTGIARVSICIFHSLCILRQKSDFLLYLDWKKQYKEYNGIHRSVIWYYTRSFLLSDPLHCEFLICCARHFLCYFFSSFYGYCFKLEYIVVIFVNTIS